MNIFRYGDKYVLVTDYTSTLFDDYEITNVCGVEVVTLLHKGKFTGTNITSYNTDKFLSEFDKA